LRRVSSLVLLAVVIAACKPSETSEQRSAAGTARTPSSPATDPVSEQVPELARSVAQDSLLTAIHAQGRSFGKSRVALRQVLGAPVRVGAMAVPNDYVEGVVDTAIGVWYSGMVFSLWRSGVTGRELLESVEVVGSSLSLPGGIRIGHSTTAGLSRLLGAPADTRASGDTVVLSYLAGGIGPDEFVEFHTVSGILRKVFWRFYVN